jgi:hypothetical protein
LNFYVQWLANYKIKEEVLNVLWKIQKDTLWSLSKEEIEKIKKTNYVEINTRVKKIKLKVKNDKLALKQLSQIEIYLKRIWKDITKILKDVASWKNLLESFDKSEKYKSVFSMISNKLDKLDK